MWGVEEETIADLKNQIQNDSVRVCGQRASHHLTS